MAILEVIDTHNDGRRFTFEDALTIGRSAHDNAGAGTFLGLAQPEVSRRHARISRGQNGYVIEDLQSTNGTHVRGTRLKPGMFVSLREGDEIRIGSTRIVFHAETRMPSSLDEDTAYYRLHAPPKLASSALFTDETSFSVTMREDADRSPDISVAIDATELIQELSGKAKRVEEDLHQTVRRLEAMTRVSIALGAVTDRDTLVTKIMSFIFDLFPTAERAFVMVQRDKGADLVPLAARTRNGDVEESNAFPLSRTIVNEVVRKKKAVLSVDTPSDERFSAQESIIALAIHSVMCVPLLTDGEVLGLIQVDNASDPYAFNSEDLKILTAVCAEAAIALKNFQLYADIENLFEGFVSASVQAIEGRDPTTAGHSFRVAEYTMRLLEAVDRDSRAEFRQLTFSREEYREVRYAALLHDFGKVGVREHVLTKGKKLYWHQTALLEQRFQYARACLERQAYKDLTSLHQQNNLSEKEFERERIEIEQYLQKEMALLERFKAIIEVANEPNVAHGKTPEELNDVARYVFPAWDGEKIPLLNTFEFSDLVLPKGSLSPQERREIESHVSHSFSFLRLIPWTKTLAAVPDIAHAHHEKLDGSGYPLGLNGDEIPIQSRMLTIADIYDALTSPDRPYKSGLSVESALTILEEESKAGKIDQKLFDVFVDSNAYLKC